jgi:hypothetical protein
MAIPFGSSPTISVVGKVALIRRANFARVALATWRVRIPKMGWRLLAHLNFDMLHRHRVVKVFELYSTFSTPLCTITQEVVPYLRISQR